MPLYDFRCPDGHKFELMVKLANFEDPQFCTCGLSASRVITAPMFSVEQVGYHCPITEKWIGSKREHENNLAQHGCRVYESGETQSQVAAKARAEAQFEKNLEETVEKEFEAMPSDKKEKLANELLSGVDISIDRKAA